MARTAGRPLASGALRPRQALVFLVVLLLVGLAVLLQLNRLAQALGVASLLLVALYPLAKRVTWWPQLVMGFTFGFGAPMGYAAATGRIDAAWAAIYAAAILWDLGFDTIYAHQDREDDALVGVELHRAAVRRAHAPVPRRLLRGGRRCCWRWRAGWPAWACGSTRRCCCPPRLLARQVVTLDIDDPALCLRLFRANREVGLAVGARDADRLALSDAEAFVRAHTVPGPPRWCRRSCCISPARSRRSGRRPRSGLPNTTSQPPFWAFAWPGGQALARHVLDHPGLVAGKRVLDFAAGGGIAAIACAMAGAPASRRPRSTRSRWPRSR